VHLTLASPPQRAASGEEDEEMSLGRASMPVGGLMAAAAARGLSVAPGSRPHSFAGARESPPTSPTTAAGVGVGMEITKKAPFIVKLLVDGVIVKLLVDGGPAHKTTQIQIGDTLVEINDNDVSMTFRVCRSI